MAFQDIAPLVIPASKLRKYFSSFTRSLPAKPYNPFFTYALRIREERGKSLHSIIHNEMVKEGEDNSKRASVW